jgi:hypothetical protein
MMKAIETRYKGYRFRSRLEARWAVFFDAIGIAWQYEPEGFVFDDGTRYLPDFYLPGFDHPDGTYVEIKPTNDGFDKARKLASKGKHVLMLDGPPTFKPFYLVGGYSNGDDVDVCFYDKYLPGGSHGDEYRFYASLGGDEYSEDSCGVAVVSAVHSSRSARFEFGESGAPK